MKEKTHSKRRKLAEIIEKNTGEAEKMPMTTMHKRGEREHMKRRKKISKKKNRQRRLKQFKKNNYMKKRNIKKRKSNCTTQ